MTISQEFEINLIREQGPKKAIILLKTWFSLETGKKDDVNDFVKDNKVSKEIAGMVKMGIKPKNVSKKPWRKIVWGKWKKGKNK